MTPVDDDPTAPAGPALPAPDPDAPAPDDAVLGYVPLAHEAPATRDVPALRQQVTAEGLTALGEAVVIGEALVDIVVGDDASRIVHPGGSPLNVAYGLAVLGVPTVFRSQIGHDGYGDAIRTHLGRAGIALEPDSIVDGPTSTATVRLDDEGRASYVFDIDWQLERQSLPPRATVLHTGSIASVLEPGATELRRLFAATRAASDAVAPTPATSDAAAPTPAASDADASPTPAAATASAFAAPARTEATPEPAATAEPTGPAVLLSYDPNVRPSITPDRDATRARVEAIAADAHVVKLSDEDAAWLYPGDDLDTVATRFLDAGSVLVGITRGADGCLLAADGVRLDLPAPPVDLVDTIGAGDAFMSGMLYAVMAGGVGAGILSRTLTEQQVRSIGETALQSARITVSRAGANPPTLAELGR